MRAQRKKGLRTQYTLLRAYACRRHRRRVWLGAEAWRLLAARTCCLREGDAAERGDVGRMGRKEVLGTCNLQQRPAWAGPPGRLKTCVGRTSRVACRDQGMPGSEQLKKFKLQHPEASWYSTMAVGAQLLLVLGAGSGEPPKRLLDWREACTKVRPMRSSSSPERPKPTHKRSEWLDGAREGLVGGMTDIAVLTRFARL